VFKFGLSKAFGSAVLPASFEFGTRSVALLFGVIGGFAGTVVLDKLVTYFLPSKPKETEKAPENPAAESHPGEKAPTTSSDSMESFENVPRRKPKNNRAAVRASGWR
jgi:hypothetical protein